MNTVISAFDDRDQAHRAMERLIERGFHRDRVRLSSGREPSITGAGSDASQSDDGFFEGISRFFSDLFGTDHAQAAHAGHYAEAVRRGGTVVVVDALDPQEAEHARRVMDELGGAIDLEERAGAWRNDGWTGATMAGSGRADNLTDDDAFARTDTNTRSGVGSAADDQSRAGGPAGRSSTLAATDASTRLESDSGTLPGTDTNTRLDFAAGSSTPSSEPAAVDSQHGANRTARAVEEVVVGRNDQERTGTGVDNDRAETGREEGDRVRNGRPEDEIASRHR